MLELPAITDTTLTEIEQVSEQKQKYLSFAEAAKLKSLTDICRLEVEHFLNRMLTQCEDAARVLLPDPVLIKNKVFRPDDKATRQTPKKFNPLAFIHE
jgi:hypothetical protein